MKIIYKDHQDMVLRHIIDIFKVLVKNEGDEATDAIIAAYRIAHIVGGKEMVKKLEGQNENSNHSRSCRRLTHSRFNGFR